MPNLEVWRCGNCGGNVPAGDAGRPVSFCGFCGAALVAPVAVSSEPVSFEVRLEHAGPSPIPVIKVLAELTSLSMGRDLVNKAPCVVLRGASQERAEQLRQKLAGAGARAIVVQTGGAAAPALVRPPSVPDPLVLGAMWYAGTEAEARRAADDTIVASARVATSQLELAIPTGGAPAAVYLVIRRADELPMVIHYNHPLRASRNLGDPLPRPRQLYQAFARILQTPLQPGTGILALCARVDESTPELAGVSFVVSPPHIQLAYVDERGGFTPGLGVTSKFGCAYALNVAPGPVQVTASHDGVTWPSTSVRVAPDLVTEIQMWR